MQVRCVAPYHSVVLQAILGFAQARNPSIKGVISNNGHTLILYNVSENDIDLIEIPTPDGKSHQNVHFISINPYFETESVNNPIRVYGLDGMVHQTYRQEEANAYRNLTTQATFLPFSKLGIPSLTDKLSEIGSSVGVSEITAGKKKRYCIRFGNDNNSSETPVQMVGQPAGGSEAGTNGAGELSPNPNPNNVGPGTPGYDNGGVNNPPPPPGMSVMNPAAIWD